MWSSRICLTHTGTKLELECLTTNVEPVPWVSAGDKSSRPGSMAPNCPRHSPHKSLASGLTSWQPRSNTVTNWEITGSTISLSKTCFNRASCRTNQYTVDQPFRPLMGFILSLLKIKVPINAFASKLVILSYLLRVSLTWFLYIISFRLVSAWMRTSTFSCWMARMESCSAACMSVLFEVCCSWRIADHKRN